MTRPAAQSARFVERLQAMVPGRLMVVTSPLMAVEYLAPVLPDRAFVAVIFTSETAVGAAVRLGVALPRLAFCVGDRTAEVALAAGFDAHSAQGDADDLVPLILGAGLQGPILHLRGQDTRGQIAERLTSAGIEAVSVTCYRQAAQPLTDEAITLLQGESPVIAPLFSPRTATLFCAAYADAQGRAPVLVAAMSPAVASAIDGPPVAAMQIAARPDAQGMADAVAALIAASDSG